MKTLEYPLMATTLTRTQCNKIMSPVLTGALPKCGVQSNMPRSLVTGSLAVQGLNIPHLHTTQVIRHLQAILRHGCCNTQLGLKMRAVMEGHTLELGSGTPFWDLPYSKWHFLATPTWMSLTWRDLDPLCLRIKGPMQQIPLQRPNDLYLMDFIMDLGLTNKQVYRLNNLRMHLQLTRLSDGVTADGARIHPNTWNSLPTGRPSQFDWPRTFRPTQEDKELWQATLRNLLPPHATHRRLATPLGPWFTPCDPMWQWWLSPQANRLYYTPKDSQWEIWTPQGNGYYISSMVPAPVPLLLVRVDVFTNSTRTRAKILSRAPQPEHTTEAPPPYSCMDTLIHLLPPDSRWAMEFYSISDNGQLQHTLLRALTPTVA
jgi:hypothetical protein